MKTVLHYQNIDDVPSGSIAASVFKGGKLPAASPDDLDKIRQLEEEFPELKALPDNKSKRDFIVSKHSQLMRKFAKDERELLEKRERIGFLRREAEKIDEVLNWADAGPKIEKPEGTSFRNLRKAVAEGRTVYFDKDLYAETPALEFEKEVFRHAEIMVIEHDWASALDGANIEDAAIRLPFDVCAFDFKFSGRRVIALATQLDTEIAFTPAIQVGDIWALFGFVVPASGYMKFKNDRGMVDLIDAIGAQVRAACIALDAEVAKTETTREPYSGSPGKNAYQQSRPYHVVSLARRAARPLEPSSASTGRRKRLHFRRGHWRHFEDHKTWIKWMLVGDPDLGFVEKEYRL